jgi:hypothetical protein
MSIRFNHYIHQLLTEQDDKKGSNIIGYHMGRPVYADPTYRPPAPKLYDEEGNYNPRFSDLPTVDPDKDAEMYPPSSQRKDFDQEAADKRREQRMRDLEDPEKTKEMIDRLTNPEVKGEPRQYSDDALRRVLSRTGRDNPFGARGRLMARLMGDDQKTEQKPSDDNTPDDNTPEGTPPDRIGGFPNIGGIVPKPGGDPGQSDYTPPTQTPPDRIGGFPNIGGIVPKPGGDPGQSDYRPPSRTPKPPREEKEEQPTPSPRQVRTGAVNISNTGTVVGAQGVGNVVGNIRTGNITTGDAPTPRERREQQKKPVKATPPKNTGGGYMRGGPDLQGGAYPGSIQGGGWGGIRDTQGDIITPDTEWRDGMPIGTPRKPLKRTR